jgi:hypothetical protein
MEQFVKIESSALFDEYQRQGLLTKLVGGRFKCLYVYKTNLEFTRTQAQRTLQA